MMAHRIPRILVLLFALSVAVFLIMSMSVHMKTAEQFSLKDMPEWNDAAMLSNVLESKRERIADLEQKLREEYDDYFVVLERQNALLEQEGMD